MTPDQLHASILSLLVNRQPMTAHEIAASLTTTPAIVQAWHENFIGAWWVVAKVADVDGFRYGLRVMMRVDRPPMVRDFAERNGV